MLPPLPFAAALPPPPPGPACATMGSSDTTCTARPAGRACPRADLSPRRSRRSRMGTSASEPAQTRKTTFPAEYMSETDCIVAKLWPACRENKGGGGGQGKERVGHSPQAIAMHRSAIDAQARPSLRQHHLTFGKDDVKVRQGAAHLATASNMLAACTNMARVWHSSKQKLQQQRPTLTEMKLMGRWPPTRARMKTRKGTPTMGLARLITQLQGGAGEARWVHPVGAHAWPCSTGQESNHDATDREQL